jgi:hypothetical protein
MADRAPGDMPDSILVLVDKARGGEPLAPDEFQRLMAFTFIRMTAELEHICAALRLTPDEEEVVSGG